MKELYEKAKETVPMSPFENRNFTNTLFILTAFFTIFFLEYSNSTHKPEVAFFATCFLLMGCLFDQTTTEFAFELYEKHPELIETGIVEQNVFLPSVPTKEDLYKARITGVDALLLAITPLYPPIGLCFGVYKLSAGLNNTAIEKRLRATLALAEERNWEDED